MITKEFLQEEYVNKKRTAIDIGNEISLSDTQVRYWVRKHGLQIHPRGGTSKTKDLVDQKFGKLKVLYQIKGNGICAVWKCECECGELIDATSNRLKHGAKACGKCPYRCNWKGFGEISGEHIAKIKAGAKKRKLEYNLNIEYLWELFLIQNRKCALSGRELYFARTKLDEQTASLDRIDSTKGYIEGNIQWLHKDINMAKQSLSQNEFIFLCSEIYKHNESK